MSVSSLPDPSDAEATVAQGNEPIRLFGRYRIQREIGRGGMGVVFLAHDEVLDVPLALKLVPESIVGNAEALLDLKKEVLRGMALAHPGIVRVHSFESDGVRAAIAMEYVEGHALSELKAREPDGCFHTAQILPWIEQLCAVLDYAHHDAKIAHRDLKPANLILTAAGRLKVADFGIAASLSDSLNRISVQAQISGTPPYMSPQQAMGERPTALDDLYSLGATLFDLLTGKPPFFRGNVLPQVMQERPPTMAERRRDLGVTGKSAIPENWESLVAACLDKDPAARPSSGAAVVAALKGERHAPAILPTVTRRSFPPLDGRGTESMKVLHTLLPAETPLPPTPVRIVLPEAVREPSPWARQVALVIFAAALTAGALHLARHRIQAPPPIAAPPTPIPGPTPMPSNASGIQPSKGLEKK